MYDFLLDYVQLTEDFLLDKQKALRRAQDKYLREQGFSDTEIEKRTTEAMLILMFQTYDDDDVDNSPGYPYNINQAFPNLFRRSLFTITYSIFETKISNRCKILREQGDLKLSVSDLNGRGIRRSKTYLEKVVGLDLSASKEWSAILAYTKLRNCLVHNDGRVSGCQYAKFLRNYAVRHKFLELDHNEILLKRGYCEEAIEALAKFYEFVFQQSKAARTRF